MAARPTLAQRAHLAPAAPTRTRIRISFMSTPTELTLILASVMVLTHVGEYRAMPVRLALWDHSPLGPPLAQTVCPAHTLHQRASAHARAQYALQGSLAPQARRALQPQLALPVLREPSRRPQGWPPASRVWGRVGQAGCAPLATLDLRAPRRRGRQLVRCAWPVRTLRPERQLAPGRRALLVSTRNMWRRGLPLRQPAYPCRRACGVHQREHSIDRTEQIRPHSCSSLIILCPRVRFALWATSDLRAP